VTETLAVLQTITRNPHRIAQLEEGAQAVSGRTGRPLSVSSAFDRSDVLAALPGAHFLLTYRLDPGLLAAGAGLRWIHFGAAGIEHSLFPALLESEVPVSLSKGIHAEVMAEYAVMGVIALAVGLPLALDAARRREWIGRALRPLHHSVSGRRLLVLGLGETGRPAARACARLGMRVRGVRRRPHTGPLPEGLEGVHTLPELDALLPQTDYLLLALPGTAATRGLMDERRLRLLPEGAGIVNLARGALLDEEALLRVLDEGHLRGAVLDSFRTEPLPPGSRLWEHPRVIATPHVAGNFDTYTERVVEGFLDNLYRLLTGAPLRFPLDREAGY
jgi:D-2-hydroxyacid dehydrogenase (NADP+)